MDMVEKAKNSLNNLQYTQARTAAREVLALGKLKRTQEIAALQVAAAAYLPDDPSARMSDSATLFLRRLARIMPSGQLPADLASPALDSQLALARRSVFGATARVPHDITVKGTESRLAIDVVSTQAAKWRLYAVTEDGLSTLIDTLPSTVGGRLSLRAHNGSVAMIQPGHQQFRVVTISSQLPDTIVMRFDATATGAVPALVEMPAVLPSTVFLPERAHKAVATGIAAGLLAGTGAWALANLARPPKTLGDEPADGRGLTVGIAIGSGAFLAGILDRGKPLLENIRKNEAFRADYLKRLGQAAETNRTRISEYAVTVTFDPEIR
jgi:hypothetical protein